MAAINLVTVGGANWTVILAQNGILSFLKFESNDDSEILCHVAIKVPIPLNATNLEVKDKLILVQFNDGNFEMYEAISDIVQVI